MIDDKKSELQSIVKETKSITDKLGNPIDPRIFDAVVALKLNNIPTSASCEGHLNWGLPYPWIDINVYSSDEQNKIWKKRNKFKKIEKLVEFDEPIKKKNRQLLLKLQNLIAEFYNQHQAPWELQLKTDAWGIFGEIRLSSNGGETLHIFSKKQKQHKLKLYQQEMQAFAGFLKNKFFK